VIVIFRMLLEYWGHDRLSFTRFLRLGIEDSIPEATTLCLFREKLAKAGLIERLLYQTAETLTHPRHRRH
jgi:IS5 family transposase